MKITVFSDSHLIHKFEEKKYRYLSSIIKDSEQIILNGDFWDGYLTTFDKFINSPWSNLFPLLKSKKAIYIYGNHDKPSLSDERVNLFSIKQTVRYELPINNKLYIFEHGNRLAPMTDETIGIKGNGRVLHFITSRTGYFVTRKFDRKLLKIMLSHFNKKIKRKIKKELNSDEFFICGHTHLGEVDLVNRFANSGMNEYGLGQYLRINENSIRIKEEWYN